MKRIFLISCVSIFLVVLILFVAVKLLGWRPFTIQNPIVPPPADSGIIVTQPSVHSVVSSPLVIEGRVNGNGWIAFEAQVGTVRLFDEAGKELALGILTVTDDNWMKVENNFQETLNFVAPKGIKSGKLVFYNENPSGEPARDKTFELPVKLSKSSSIR